MTETKIHSIKLFIVTLFLVFPISIMQSDDSNIALPISLLLIPFSLKSFIFFVDNNKKYLILSVLCSLFSVVFIGAYKDFHSFKPYLSMIFFYVPIVFYFWSNMLVLTEDELDKVLRYFSFNIITFTLIYFYSIFTEYSGHVRYDSNMNGDIFGLKLVGAYGIHTLGAHLFVLMFILLFALYRKVNGKLMNILSVIAILLFVYGIVMSLSRELVLGLIICYTILAIKKWGWIKASVIIFLCSSIFVYIFIDLIEFVLRIWETKIAFSKTTDLNELSSGRLDLQFLALEQIKNNPIFATGFQGYGLNYTSYKGYDDLEGWSTHIYLLTALWKMGILAFAFFLYFFYRIIRKVKVSHLNENVKNLFWIFIITFFIVNLFWDALLAPNIMMIFVFIIGMFNVKKNM